MVNRVLNTMPNRDKPAAKTNRRLLALIAPAALIACTGGAASAQFIVERSAEVDVARVAEPSNTVTMRIVRDRDGRVSEVSMENGVVVSARHDGEDWPLDRVRVNSNARKVELLGKDGVVVYHFELPAAPAAPASPDAPRSWSGTGSDDRRVGRRIISVPPSGLTPPAAPAAPAGPNPPPVMLGINMSEPGDALRAHLGLGDRNAILIEGVIEGLPAARAGLKQHDIIVSIAGSDGASDRMLGETLRNAKPGQTLTLKVRRGGETIEITPELEAYDAERLSSGPSVMVFRGEGEGEGWWDRLEFRVEGEKIGENAKRLAELAARGGQEGAEELQRLAEEIQREASRQVFELRDNRLFLRSREQMDALMQEQREQMDAVIRESRQLAQKRADEARGRVEEMRPQIQESMDERLKQIESRMDSIEKSLDSRLERLSAMLDRLADRLEKDGGE